MKAAALSRRRISSEPLINLVHDKVQTLLAVASLMFIGYVTCLPDFSAAGSEFHSSGKQDIVQNIALYVPFGLFMALVLRCAAKPWLTTSVTTVFAALALSSTIEMIQNIVPGRTPSATDTLMNSGGACLGVIIAMLARSGSVTSQFHLKDKLRHQPVFLTFLLAAGLYGILTLVPFAFDPSSNIRQLWHQTARPADSEHVGPASAESPAFTLREQYDRKLESGVVVLCFVVLGFLGGLSLRKEYGFSTVMVVLVLMWMLVLISTGVAVTQCLLQGVQGAWAKVPWGLLGGSLGLAASYAPPYRESYSEAPRAYWAWPAVVLIFALICARNFNPFEFGFRWNSVTAQLTISSLVPFQKYFHSPALSASTDILAKSGRFFVLGVFLLVAQKHSGVRTFRKRFKTGMLLIVMSTLLLEIVELGCHSRSFDITHALVSIAGGACGLVAMQWWFDVVKAYRHKNRALGSLLPF